MSRIDGTDPQNLSDPTEEFEANFSADSFVEVPLNQEQLLEAIDYMQEALIRMPPSSNKMLQLRTNVRNMLGAYETALQALQTVDAPSDTASALDCASVDPVYEDCELLEDLEEEEEEEEEALQELEAVGA